jgi:hypothetical protein
VPWGIIKTTHPESLVIAGKRRHDRHELDGKTVPLFAKANVSIGVSG